MDKNEILKADHAANQVVLYAEALKSYHEALMKSIAHETNRNFNNEFVFRIEHCSQQIRLHCATVEMIDRTAVALSLAKNLDKA